MQTLKEAWDVCKFWIALGALISLCALAALLCGNAEARKEKQFMEECRRERKQYECTAMWRSGEHTGGAVYVPVIIPAMGQH